MKDASGTTLDLTAQADELGIRSVKLGAGIAVMRDEIDATLGPE